MALVMPLRGTLVDKSVERKERHVVWSPRRLAELAGISRRAVRHYHEIGLLPAPRRRSNGYQQYGVDHLVRLLRIRRMTQLGLTLPQIAALGDTEQLPVDVLHDLEAELARTIDGLQQTRAELVSMIEQAVPLDLPAPVARRTEGLPAAERALVVVLSRLLRTRALDAYLDLLPPYRAHAAVVAFDNLPADAAQPDRTAVAVGVAEHMGHLSTCHADQLRLVDGELRASPSTRETVRQAVSGLYNPAQLDVLSRALRNGGRTRP